jgi:hypothetical protein
MVISPAGLEPENDRTGEGQQELSSSQRGCYIRAMTARVQLKMADRESQYAWCQDELIKVKPTVSSCRSQ